MDFKNNTLSEPTPACNHVLMKQMCCILQHANMVFYARDYRSARTSGNFKSGNKELKKTPLASRNWRRHSMCDALFDRAAKIFSPAHHKSFSMAGPDLYTLKSSLALFHCISHFENDILKQNVPAHGQHIT